MGLEALVRNRGAELGVSEEVVDEIWMTLGPTCSLFSESTDVGIYFFSAERCEEICTKNALPDVAVILWWDICRELRKDLKGTMQLNIVYGGPQRFPKGGKNK